MMDKVDGATALDVFRGFEGAFGPLDEALPKTLTYDQGKEMALHKKLAPAEAFFEDCIKHNAQIPVGVALGR